MNRSPEFQQFVLAPQGFEEHGPFWFNLSSDSDPSGSSLADSGS